MILMASGGNKRSMKNCVFILIDEMNRKSQTNVHPRMNTHAHTLMLTHINAHSHTYIHCYS